VEPRNALLAGVDLVGSMLAVGAGEHPVEALPARSGVRSHQLLLAILEAARSPAPRRAVAAELWAAARRGGPYAGSVEELTPVRRDPYAAVPVAVAAAATLAFPPAWRWFVSGAVEAYSLARTGWDEILAEVRRAPAGPNPGAVGTAPT
jgi:hypothetical protein